MDEEKTQTPEEQERERDLWHRANAGEAEAQYRLGLMYETGEGAPQQVDRTAIEQYLLAAKQGHSKSQYNLSRMCREGRGMEANNKEARRWLLAAAEGGNLIAQHDLGKRCAEVRKDFVQAYMWLMVSGYNGHKPADELRAQIEKTMDAKQIAEGKKLAEKRLGIEQHSIAYKYSIGMVALWLHRYKDLSVIAKAALVVVLIGVVGAVFFAVNQGMNMYEQSGIKRGLAAFHAGDYAAAARILEPPSDRGEAEAQYFLGIIHRDGLDTEADPAAAARLFRAAAAEGHENAAYSLGLLFKEGEGVAQNYQEAAKLFYQASHAGKHAEALYHLALLHEKGRGVKRDREFALQLHGEAAALSYPQAHFRLGEIYEKGLLRVERDFRIAYAWYSMSSSSGYERATEAAENLEGRLSREDLEWAQNFVNDCEQRGYKECG
ncbi:MAG: sel1 repeat family protein [Alphaproteobacteria bacterium]|nr:sel1 repeat family protein [Alphaproteobacteria bacterium]MDA8000860.1 sel1 repeat family protein [Alphaproteobacteria bacterium]MDA8006065.1 sel1 repeat family protein [Alphaproteobacteria bacterium]MDA8013194.1 sel1 repeat family protein [Alphaproteobacteria bacterium]